MKYKRPFQLTYYRPLIMYIISQQPNECTGYLGILSLPMSGLVLISSNCFCFTSEFPISNFCLKSWCTGRIFNTNHMVKKQRVGLVTLNDGFMKLTVILGLHSDTCKNLECNAKIASQKLNLINFHDVRLPANFYF